jgi:hypothetical protein
MIPDRIGIIGRTQGVNASTSPQPKNFRMTAKRLPPVMRSARLSCSDTIDVAPPGGSAPGAGVPAAGSCTATDFVTGG